MITAIEFDKKWSLHSFHLADYTNIAILHYLHMKERNIYEAVRIFVNNGLCGYIEMTNHNEKVSSYEVL